MTTIKLATKSIKLNPDGFHESLSWACSEWDKWENETYTRKVNPVGAVKEWVLSCWEGAVPWPSSVVKHFQDQADAGAVCTFEFTAAGNMHSMIEEVYIKRVEYDLNLVSDTTTPLREYTLELRRKQ